MAIRVNTLGKSAIVNRQLNSSYDIVEYVADNLPLLVEMTKKIDTLKIVKDIYDFINHIHDTDIHLSEEQVNSINQIAIIQEMLDSKGVDITSLSNNLTSILNTLNDHIANTEVHITEDERTKWNAYAQAISDLVDVNTTLHKVAYSGDYNDLENKPVIQNITVDSTLSSTSTNPVENQAITNRLDNYAEKDSLSEVAFTGSYSDLQGIPQGDTQLNENSQNWVTNECITKALQGLQGYEVLTNAEIDSIIASLN